MTHKSMLNLMSNVRHMYWMLVPSKSVDSGATLAQSESVP